MPRTSLTPQAALGSYAGLLAVTMTAADVANKNQFQMGGRDLLIIQNTGASPYTVTITSVNDPFGRSGDITTASLAAGDIKVLGPLELTGWRQTDGNLYLEASNASVKFGIIRL